MRQCNFTFDEPVHTIDESALFCRVHPKTIRRAIDYGELKAWRAGAQWRVPERELFAWLRRNARRKKRKYRSNKNKNLSNPRENDRK